MKSLQIQSFFWSLFFPLLSLNAVFSPTLVQENTDQEKLRIWKLFRQWFSILRTIDDPDKQLDTFNKLFLPVIDKNATLKIVKMTSKNYVPWKEDLEKEKSIAI